MRLRFLDPSPTRRLSGLSRRLTALLDWALFVGVVALVWAVFPAGRP